MGERGKSIFYASRNAHKISGVDPESTEDSDFNESDHPRSDDGKFGSGSHAPGYSKREGPERSKKMQEERMNAAENRGIEKEIERLKGEKGSKARNRQFELEQELHDRSKRGLYSASKDSTPPQRLSYYASLLPGKENQFETPGEGYRIYKNVPIARTGSQQYLGREIRKTPDTSPNGASTDDEMVTVYRPIEEVTAPETLASFEGKSVLDEHPADPQILVDALDEYEGVSKGHGQNVRIGEKITEGEFAGETPLLADLHVKHPDLNVKVDSGVRDVSCGYTFRLGKDEAGRYIMTQIRGNHIAIVPKGRAGSDVGIKDAKPESDTILVTRRTTMSNRLLVALGLQAAIKDASPKEAAEMIDALKDEDEEEKKEERETKDKAAKDRKAARDAEDEDDEETAEEKKERLEKRKAAKDKAAKDKAKDEFGDDEMTDAEKEEEEEREKKEAKDKAARDAEGAIVLPPDEHSKSDFSTGDAADLLKMLKPVVARSGNKGAKDAYVKLNKQIGQLASGVKDGAPDPFVMLTRIVPEGGIGDSTPEPAMFTFFNGKSYADGLKAYNEYQVARAARK